MTAPDPLKIVFMGTPDFAAVTLRRLIDGPHDVIAVYTRSPSAKGRGQQIQKTPVHDLADAHAIPVYMPASLKKSEDEQKIFENLGADVAIVAAYGLILPPRVLAAPRFGCVNIHGSLLPRWRGAAPIQRAILAGDKETGITLMQMDEGMDTGPMIAARAVPIAPDTTTPTLFDTLAALGADMMADMLDGIARDRTPPLATPQDPAYATHAPMISRADAVVDFTRPAEQLDRQVRALTPWPGVCITTPKGDRIKILSGGVEQSAQKAGPPGTLLNKDGDIACGEGTVYRIHALQSPAGKKMDMAAFINGGAIAVGDVLTP